jgi:hypothetical protein
MKEYLFSYGTLQKENLQVDLFGRTLPGTADVLKGYRVAAIEITDEAFLSKGEEKLQKTLVCSHDKNDMVGGTALEVTNTELLIADKYEPANYKRTSVTLESGKRAWIYVAVKS